MAYEETVFSHPYYPSSAPIAHFAENASPVVVLLASFVAILTITILTVLVLARRLNPSLTTSDQLTLVWFSLCGFLHCFFEGYFVRNHDTLAGLQSLFGQLWKEYALSDSRYLTSDTFMLCVESITVFLWGPLCWAIVISIVRGSYIRYPLQIIMSVGHLYGVALYYTTSLTESYFHGVFHSRPEFLYFWVYYVGLNAPWVVVPSVLLISDVRSIRRAFEALEKAEVTLQRLRVVMGSKTVDMQKAR